MRIAFRPEARAEALEAKAWYESKSRGLGLEFARAIDAALAAAFRNPSAFAKVEGECRRVVLRKFPYSLVYLVSSSEFLVVSVLHHRREPRSFASRVGG